MSNRPKIVLVLVASLLLVTGYAVTQNTPDHSGKTDTNGAIDNHEGHDHAEENDLEVNEDPGSDDEHEGHSDELAVELTPEAMELAGIVISSVKFGRIDRTIELPGEVGLNEDRVVHIAPRFAGVALQANFRVGDYVKQGAVVAVVESNESLNSYSIEAPISGWVIERHITTGEFVSDENSIFVIADLSTVWVDLAVYPKDADRIKVGQLAEIKGIGSENITAGSIEYVTRVMDIRTRSLTARITLPNPDNKWHPGSFVQATITTKTGNKGLMVEKNAVQFLEETNVLFVVEGTNRFVPIEVITGESDDKHIQILSELSPSTEYVSNGAFELKAKLVTSNLDAHAGHGH